MTNEQKKTEFDEWEKRNEKWLHFQISIGRLGEVIEKTFEEGLNIGFTYGVKAKINITTISDAPLDKDQDWHDMRENPEDTPPLGIIIMVYDFINRNYRLTVGAEKEWYKGRQIAWRKLPEPPEV